MSRKVLCVVLIVALCGCSKQPLVPPPGTSTSVDAWYAYYMDKCIRNEWGVMITPQPNDPEYIWQGYNKAMADCREEKARREYSEKKSTLWIALASGITTVSVVLGIILIR